MGVELGLRGLPAGTPGTVPPAGLSSDAGVAALDGDIGVADRGGAEAPRASEIPPCAAIINKTDDRQTAAVLRSPQMWPATTITSTTTRNSPTIPPGA